MRTGEQLRKVFKPSAPRPACFAFERNDCTVHALVNAFDISYQTAWKFCSVHGRQPKEGFNVMAHLPAFNCDEVLQECTSRQMTLSQVMPFLRFGTFLVLVKGHIFTVKNGVMIDYAPKNYRLIKIWKVR
jgi:hypothetical protein